MRVSMGLTGLVLASLACQDVRAPIPTSPASQGPHMSRERSRSDFDFTAAAESDEVAEATMLAIVDHPLAQGEAARAVREPGNEGRGIVVLSAFAFDDRALFLGSSALDLDVRRFPSIAQPRVVRVWDDGRVTSEADGVIGSVDLSLVPTERTSGTLEYLRARTAEESTVEIPRIGRARLLKF